MKACPLDPEIEKNIQCQNKRKKRRRRKKKTVRTLYISGLPTDVKAREVYLMFRSFTGYQGSILLTRNEGEKRFPVAFVTFENREHAKVAELALQGKQFDPEQSSTMNIEFAKEDTKSEKFTHSTLAFHMKKKPLEVVETPNVETCTSPACTPANPLSFQANPQMVNWNYNYNPTVPFLPPFYMGMTPLPPTYPGIMFPPSPVLSQPSAGQEFIS